jgi:hypothetical protein
MGASSCKRSWIFLGRRKLNFHAWKIARIACDRASFFVAMSQRSKMRATLADASMLWELLENEEGFGVILSLGGSWTSAIEIDGIDPTAQTDDLLAQGLDALKPFLAALPTGWLVRFHAVNSAPTRIFSDVHAATNTDLFLSAITHERSKAQKCLNAARSIRLLVTLSTPSKRIMRMRMPKIEPDLGCLSDLNAQTKRLVASLCSIGMNPTQLNAPRVHAWVLTLCQPLTKFHEERAPWDPNQSLHEQLAKTALQISPSWVASENYQRAFALSKLPREVWPACLWAIQGLPHAVHLVATLRGVDPEKALASLDAARRRSLELQRLRGKIRGVDASRDASSMEMVAQLEDMLAHLASGDGVCEAAFQAQVFDEDVQGLNAASASLQDAISAMAQGVMVEERFRHEEATASMVPGNEALIGDRFEILLTSRATRLVPVFAPRRGSPSPEYLMHTHPGEPWGWSSLCGSRVAHNAVVMSSTGSGKSFVVRCLNLPHFLRGGQGVVVTSGSDYNFYAQVIGNARIVRVDPEDDTLALSPMVSRDDYNQDPEGVLSDIANVILVMSESVPLAVSRRRRLIIQILGSFYKKYVGENPPTLADVVKIPCEGFSDDPEDVVAAKAIVRCIKDWLVSPCGKGLLRLRPKLDEKLIVYDIEPIGDDVEAQRLVLALITADVNRMIAKDRSIIILDECWKILSSETGSYLAANLYRTVRKKGSAVWGISQSVQDWMDLPPSTRQAILTNTSIELFLRSKPLEAKSIAQAFSMNDAEMALLMGLQAIQGSYSDVLVSIENKRQVVRLVPTGTELWLATSDKRDLDLRRSYAERYPHLTCRELAWGLGRKYPNGAPRMQEAA